MREYFESEMRLLRESAKDFSRQHPELAAKLRLQNASERDPFVERLLEGFAYLTAQVKQRVDDDSPDLTEALLQQLCPNLIRPIPSMTILQCQSIDSMLQQSYTLTKGATVCSKPVSNNKVICKFQTTQDLVVNPMSIESMTAKASCSGGMIFCIEIHAENKISLCNLDLSKLQLYVNAEATVAQQILMVLTHKIKKIEVTSKAKSIAKLDKKTGFSLANLTNQACMLPEVGAQYQGYNLLLEYLAFREKHFFIDVNGLDEIAWPDDCDSFVLEIHTEHVLPESGFPKHEYLQLNCVPAINLYSSVSEPIKLNHKQFEYPVLPSLQDQKGIQLYSIEKVVGLKHTSGEQIEYHAMHNHQHWDENKAYYHCVSGHPKEGFSSAFIRFAGNQTKVPETISCELLVCNGYLPQTYLQEHSLQQNNHKLPSFLLITNLTQPSDMHKLPHKKRFNWSLLSYLALSFNSIASRESLVACLKLYDWSGKNSRRIESIQSFDTTPKTLLKKGVLRHGIEIKLTLDEAGFNSQGEMYLFLAVLHGFFTQYSTINCFVHTSVQSLPSKCHFQFE